ncbi:MAG: YiiX/YebB-like N1pC/P60 family cysteine hydrolase [Myxococcaceae bacterium]
MTSLLLTLTVLAAAPVEGDVYSLSEDAFVETARHDLDTLKQFVDGMRGVMKKVDGNKTLFNAKADTVYSPEQKQTLLSTWGSLFAYFSATEGLRHKYWNFVKLSPTDKRHAWGFLVTHTALTALLSQGLKFAEYALNNKQLEILFDEENDEYGIPKGAFAAFKMKAIHVATSVQLFTGDNYGVLAVPLLKKQKGGDAPGVKWAVDEMKADSGDAKKELVKHGGKLFLGNAKDIAVDTSMETIFPAQKTFAEWMGDTRVARIGKPLLTEKDITTLVLPRLEPGDILVTRQNWFLSNIGLPGFWPHALLYVGATPDLIMAFDADPEVSKWAAAQPEKAATFSQLLEKRYPAKWKTYSTEKDFQGHGPIRVIESISEGVSFTATEHAFGVDYLAALRPRLSKVEKARAIERAFKYQGRPYDFDFDFFSDASLVCTELVYKSYQPAADAKGITIELVDVAGRRTLPANEFIKRFDAEADSKNPQMDFVFFLDGREKEGKVVDSDAAALRASWKRLKWDIAQK